MLRYFVKPTSALASQKIHLVPKMTPLSVIETIEDISSWKGRPSEPTVTLFTHCLSHALSLLPELRALGVVRILFAYSKASISMDHFVPSIAEFLLQECKEGQLYESFYTSCTVNDLLLLYKGFETNRYYNSKLHNILVDCIINQKIHMTASDICLFLKSHSNYLIAYEKENKAIEPLLYSEFVNEVTLRVSQMYRECLPGELANFVDWLASMKKYYEMSTNLVNSICNMFSDISKSAIYFNAEQLLSIVQSCCKLYKDTNKEFQVIIELISSMLQEIERRNDVLDFDASLETLYLLSDIRYQDFDRMQSIIYTVVNNSRIRDHVTRIHNVIEDYRRMLSTGASIRWDLDHSNPGKISEILERLDHFRQREHLLPGKVYRQCE